MFELANRLVGIYKTNDTTKSVTINPHCFENIVASSQSSSTNTMTKTSITMDNQQKTTTTTTISSSFSPVPKKGRLSHNVNEMQGEENQQNKQSLASRKLSSESLIDRQQNKSILGDSTNKI